MPRGDTRRKVQADGPQRWQKLVEIASDAGHKAVDIQPLNSQSMDVRESGIVEEVVGVECLWSKPAGGARKLTHSNFFHERDQAQLMHFGQRLQLVMSGVKHFILESEGMVDVWDRDDVPGTTSQRAFLEGVEIVGKVGDDHFRGFERQATTRLVFDANLGRRVIDEATDLGFASVPSHHRQAVREAEPFGANHT